LFRIYKYDMATFQAIVSITAIVTLVLIFILVLLALQFAKNNGVWPPVLSQCPDYWVDQSTNGSKCVNVKDLGTCHASTSGAHTIMDFSTPNYRGSNGLCQKYNWATNCGISWDGITYGVTNPCAPPAPKSTSWFS